MTKISPSAVKLALALEQVAALGGVEIVVNLTRDVHSGVADALNGRIGGSALPGQATYAVLSAAAEVVAHHLKAAYHDAPEHLEDQLLVDVAAAYSSIFFDACMRALDKPKLSGAMLAGAATPNEIITAMRDQLSDTALTETRLMQDAEPASMLSSAKELRRRVEKSREIAGAIGAFIGTIDANDLRSKECFDAILDKMNEDLPSSGHKLICGVNLVGTALANTFDVPYEERPGVFADMLIAAIAPTTVAVMKALWALKRSEASPA